GDGRADDVDGVGGAVEDDETAVGGDLARAGGGSRLEEAEAVGAVGVGEVAADEGGGHLAVLQLLHVQPGLVFGRVDLGLQLVKVVTHHRVHLFTKRQRNPGTPLRGSWPGDGGSAGRDGAEKRGSTNLYGRPPRNLMAARPSFRHGLGGRSLD